MMWGPHMMYGGWGFFFMILLGIVLTAVVVWVLARGSQRSGISGTGGAADIDERSSSREETALEILQKRYARGEVTKEEYESIRSDLAS